jgi:apolipoprotein D and lipocalin family protein
MVGLRVAAILGVLAPLAGAPAEGRRGELPVVETVDLSRYTGTWYEIARTPNWFQKKCVGFVKATYARREDGTLSVVNECRTASGRPTRAEGVARLAEKGGPQAKLKVRFAPAFLSFISAVWGDYWIIDLAPDYSYAVVGEPARRYLWILSRTPQMEAAQYEEIVRRAGVHYEVSRLARTPQE